MKKLILLLLIILLPFNTFALELQPKTPNNFTFGNNAESTQNITAVSTYDDGYEAHSNVQITTSTSQAGGSVCFDVPSVLISGHLYNFVIIVSAGYPVSIPTYNNYTFLRAGYYVADAMTRKGATELKYFNATPYTDYGTNAYSLVYLFSVNGQYNSVCLPVATTTQTTAYWSFYAWGYEDNGFADQLTTQDIQNIINSSNTLITNAISNSTTTIIQGQEEINDTIKDDNVDDNNVTSKLDSFKNMLAQNSTITSLLTMPITLYSAVLNSLDTSCQPYSLGTLFQTEIVLPCINIQNYVGSTIWGVIDVLFTGLMIFHISRKMIKVFEHFSSLKEGDVIDD